MERIDHSKSLKRTLSRVCTVGVVLFLCVSCDSREESITKHMERGHTYFKEGQYNKARLEFANALQIDPKNVEALYKIGEIAETQQNLRLAFQVYSKVEIEAPQHIDAMNRLGHFYLAAGDVAKSTNYADKILKFDPNNAGGLTLRGIVYLRKEDYKEAEADALSALRQAPDDVNATALLASIYHKQTKVNKALQTIETGLGTHPDETLFHLLKVDVYLKSGQRDEAEQAYLTLIERKPKNTAYLISLAKLYLQWKRKADAEKLLRAAVSQTPDDDKLKLILTDFLANQISFEAAEKELNAYLKTAPDNISLLSGLAALYDRQKFLDKAKLVFEEIRTLDPKGQQGLDAGNALARIGYQAGEFDTVRKLVSSMLSVAPRDPDALIMRARLAMRDEAWPEAIIDLRTVLRDQQSSKTAYALLAGAQIKSENWPLARDALERLVRLSPKSEAIRLDLARVLLKLDAPDEAVAQLKQYSDKVPSSAKALKLLAEILTNQGRYDEAEVIVEQMAALEKSEPAAQAAFGAIYLKSGRYDDALAAYRIAMEFNPASEPALLGAVRSLIGKKNFDAGLEEVDSFLGLNQSSAYAFYLQGGLYFHKRSPELAIASLHRAIKQRPEWKDPYLALGRYYLSQQQTLKDAINILQEGFEKTGSNEEVGFFLALAQQRNEDIDSAIHTYEAIIKRNPRHQASANNLASLIADYKFNDRKQLERAHSLVEQFRSAKQPVLLDTLGWVHFRLGNIKTAVAILEQAVAAAPDAAELKFHLSSAYVDNGQADLAREHLQSILKNSKNSTFSKKAQELLSKIPKG